MKYQGSNFIQAQVSLRLTMLRPMTQSDSDICVNGQERKVRLGIVSLKIQSDDWICLIEFVNNGGGWVNCR